MFTLMKIPVVAVCRQALRALWRDVRAGELRLLMLAVLLAVAALSAVGFFANRLQGGLQRDARQLLGGDVVVVSDHAPPAEFVRKAQEWGLRTVQTASFPTMARAEEVQGGASRLVSLKSVVPGYPLRGSLQVSEAADRPGQPTRAIPAAGEAWVDAALLEALDLRVGDAVLLGDAALRIARVIALEPDRGAGFMSFVPRVMIAASELPATGLVQAASRVTWRLAVAGDDARADSEAAVQRWRAWAQGQMESGTLRGMRIESLDSGRPEMRQTLDRAEKFLRLVALLAALLSAVAVALAARGFAGKHLDAAAMLRVLGQSQRRIAASYTLEFLLAGLLASSAGVLLGWGLHHGFVWLLAGLLKTTLPAAGLWPALLGLGMGVMLLLAFGLPPVLQLAQVPPLRVMRRELGQIKAASAAVLGVGVAGFAALLLAVSRDVTLGLIAAGGFAAAALLFALLAWLALHALRRLVHEGAAPRALVLATRQMAARPAYAVVQVSSLAVGLLALVLLVLLRTDLIASWQQATPEDAYNRFVINIQPDQAQDFRAALENAGVADYDWYPMIRGRLVAVNGAPVGPQDYGEERARRLVDREFNLSTAARLPAHNLVTAGRWVGHAGGEISVEEDIARTLGLKLGDTLRFDIAGMAQEARITSLRRVDWGSMRANFFIIYPVEHLENVPLTYLAAYRVPPAKGFDNALVRQFPNITNVNLSVTLAQVQGVLRQVTRAVEFLFGFTLAAGLVVLFAATSATREERAREYAIMRALGARAALLAQVQRAELVGVGLLAGLLASCAAMVVGRALAHWVFGFSWGAPWWVPLAGSACGALLAWAAGWYALREVLQRPVMVTLRQAQQ